MNRIILSNGISVPSIRMGTYPMTKLTLIKALTYALRNGYEGFDTTHAYYNERWCKYAIWFSNKKREEIFITTKVSNVQQLSGDIRGALQNSLKSMGIKYVDLYLIH